MQALLTSLAVLSISISALADAPAGHLQQAKIRYPYSLIGEDHGVLSEQDLAMSTCNTVPTPFASHDFSSYYWKCFESKGVSVQCDSGGEQDPHEGVMGFIVLDAAEGGESHDYIARRPWPIHECRQFIRDVRKRLRGTDYACIMGSGPSTDSKPPERMKYSWIFEAIRTRTGCESYFQQCDLSDLVKKGECEPSPLLGPILLSPDPNFWVWHKAGS